MPLYTITTQAGVLDGPAKSDLAEKVTAFHAEYAAIPRNWVHIVFHEYPVGNGFSSGGSCPTSPAPDCRRQPAHPMGGWMSTMGCGRIVTAAPRRIRRVCGIISMRCTMEV
jgi:phenylpyruvate tautomerase PptA (4-oxalocrotonate tautomerase family)